MTTVDISQSSLSLAFMAAAQAEEALAAIVGFVPQFFNTRAQVIGLQGPSFAYVRADETNGGVPTLYFWDGTQLKQMTSNADFAAALTVTNAIANGTAADAGTLTGAEKVSVSRGAGLLSTTLQKLATWILSLVCPPVATFASLPASPTGFYLVLADETKSGAPTIYFFTATHRYWIAMVQDA